MVARSLSQCAEVFQLYSAMGSFEYGPRANSDLPVYTTVSRAKGRTGLRAPVTV